MTRPRIAHSTAPPDHLSERSCRLWRAVVPGRVKEPERLALVRLALEALEALDRADVLRTQIDADGVLANGQAHPLLWFWLEHGAAFDSLWHRLGLHETDLDE